jgi:hypothetical protein
VIVIHRRRYRKNAARATISAAARQASPMM